MASHCQSCEIIAKYKYWKVLTPVKRSFLKRMSGRFHLQMVIPKEFKECFKNELENKWCILQGPSGNEWKVKGKQINDSIGFTDGWINFVKDHGLKLGESCVFSYLGDSTFEVLVFNQWGSEREGAYFTHNSSSFPTPIACLSSLHSHPNNLQNDVPDQDLREEDESKASGWSDEQQDTDDDSYFPDQSVLGHKTCKRKHPESSDDEDHQSDTTAVSHKKRGRPSVSQAQGRKQSQTVFKSRRREVTKEEIQRAHDTATVYVLENRSDVPSVQITMLPTHVYQGFHMTIKKEWALQYMCLEDHDVKLRVPGDKGSWVIGCRWTSSNQCQLRCKWPNFVWDNNLEEHDVCVFELVRQGNPKNRKKAIMDVRIFRVVNNITPVKKVRKSC